MHIVYVLGEKKGFLKDLCFRSCLQRNPACSYWWLLCKVSHCPWNHLNQTTAQQAALGAGSYRTFFMPLLHGRAHVGSMHAIFGSRSKPSHINYWQRIPNVTKDKNLFGFTYMYNLKSKWINRNKLVDTRNKLVVAREEEGEGMGKISEGD